MQNIPCWCELDQASQKRDENGNDYVQDTVAHKSNPAKLVPLGVYDVANVRYHNTLVRHLFAQNLNHRLAFAVYLQTKSRLRNIECERIAYNDTQTKMIRDVRIPLQYAMSQYSIHHKLKCM